MSTLPPSLPDAVPEIERRMRWRLLPVIAFIALLVLLLVIGLVGLLAKPRRPQGLPGHPGVAEAMTLVADGVRVPAGGLRYRATVLGGEAQDSLVVSAVPERIARARAALDRARRDLARDPRLPAALGALSLAEHDYRRAEREFRTAVEQAPHYGEARLGLGLALAMRADLTPDLWQSRALRMQAAAQFAVVDPRETEYPHAVYDRALMLGRVGRLREAARYAWTYFRMDSTSAWAERLRREVFEGR